MGSEQESDAPETDKQDTDRPLPGPGDTTEHGSDEQAADQHGSDKREPSDRDPDENVDLSEIREGDGQEYLDRDKIDFDPDDGLYSGTAVEGTSEIPGPHDEEGDEASIKEQAEQMADDKESGEPKAEQGAHDEHTENNDE